MSNIKTVDVEADVDLDEFEAHELAKSLIPKLDDLDDADKEKILDELGYDEDDLVKEHMIGATYHTVGEIEGLIEYNPEQSKFEFFIENFDKIQESDLRKIVDAR